MSTPSTGAGSNGIRLVTELPGRAWHRRVGSGMALLLGYLLILVGVIVAIPAVVLVIFVPIAAFSGDATPEQGALLVGSVAGSWFALWLGRRLARGRRHLVLFLRKFGFNDATEALTYAVSGALGRRWRLVTLDDTEVEAVGVHPGSRAAWSLVRWGLLALLVVAVGVAANWYFGGGIDSLFSGIMDPIVDQAVDDAENPLEAIGAAFVAALVGALVAGVILAMIMALAVLALSTLGVAHIAAWRVDRAVRHAEGSKALIVDQTRAIGPTMARVRGSARGIQAPRLIVLKVADQIWRDVVQRLSDEATVAVVDISDPSDHLVWEVDLLQRDVRARMVLIGRRDRVEALLDGSGTSAETGRRLRELLAGQDVLVYESESASLRRFAQTLAAAFDGSGRSSRARAS